MLWHWLLFSITVLHLLSLHLPKHVSDLYFLSVPFIVLTLAFLFCVFLFRRKVLLVLVSVFVILLLSGSSINSQRFFNSPAKSSHDITVASFNYGFGLNEKRNIIQSTPAFFQWVKAQADLDVICMQEFLFLPQDTFRLEEKMKALGFSHQNLLPYSEKESFMGLKIYSKIPFEVVRNYKFKDSSSDFHGFQHIRVFHLQGTLHLINTHLNSYGLKEAVNWKNLLYHFSLFCKENERKNKQVDFLLDYIINNTASEESLIWLGDFNSLRRSYTHEKISRAGFKDAHICAGENSGETLRNNKIIPLRIDYQFTKNLHIENSKTDASIPVSDHIPLICTYRF